MLLAQLSTARDALTVDLSLDWRVLAFTAVVAIATALLFGVAPAWRAGRVDPNDALKQQGRTVVGHARRVMGHPLIVVQVALSLVLVFAAGLFMRTFSTLATLDLGFDRDPVLLVSVDNTPYTPFNSSIVFVRSAMASAFHVRSDEET